MSQQIFKFNYSDDDGTDDGGGDHMVITFIKDQILQTKTLQRQAIKI